MARRPTADFKRYGKKQPEKARVLIVCEDEKFTVHYFEDLCRDLKINSIVKITGESGSAPQSVLEYALELATAENKKDRKCEKSYGYDVVYCVIDKDEHSGYENLVNNFDKKVKSALSKKSKNTERHPEFKLITSIRCFEIWILLHLTYSSKAFNDQDSLLSEIQAKACKWKDKDSLIYKALSKDNAKKEEYSIEGRNHSLYDILQDYRDNAIKNAEKLRVDMKKTHGDSDTELRLNADPYTEIDRLVTDLQRINHNLKK